VISINNLNVTFGGFTLFDKINLHISPKERVALVGKNGAGKSTLLKIIFRIESPTSGSVSVKQGITMGYLPQQMEHSRERSVIAEALTAFSLFYELKRELASLTELMAVREDYHSKGYNALLQKINDLNDRIRIFGSDNPEGSAERTLKGLGFKPDELNRPTSTFSEGWNMRIELAKILLRKPDLLLLDEPTNHLDIESIQWLENYLESYPGALLLISHDRRFLDNVTNRTLDLMLGKIYDYKVPFSRYQGLREELINQKKAAYINQQKMIEKTEEFIEKFRYKPTKSNQVQSRIKQLENIERIELEPEDKSTLSVKFPAAPRSGDVVIKASGLKKQYGNKIVFDNLNLVVRRGEKVALAGRNGEGKSTFIKIVAGELPQSSGVLETGHNVSLGYYAQNQDELLNNEDTVYDTLDNIATGDVRTRIRDILGAFLFRGDDIDKRVSVLSGGERSRLAMAMLILKPHNLLLFDEPTNHMDIRSKDVLKQALKSYGGTVVIVSHDRDFLDGLVDKVYEFRQGKVIEHLGGVGEFLLKLKREQSYTNDSCNGPEIQLHQESGFISGEDSYKQQKERERVEKRKRSAIRRCEEEIERTETQIKEMEKRFSDSSDHSPELYSQFETLKSELEKKYREWEKLHI